MMLCLHKHQVLSYFFELFVEELFLGKGNFRCKILRLSINTAINSLKGRAFI